MTCARADSHTSRLVHTSVLNGNRCASWLSAFGVEFEAEEGRYHDGRDDIIGGGAIGEEEFAHVDAVVVERGVRSSAAAAVVHQGHGLNLGADREQSVDSTGEVDDDSGVSCSLHSIADAHELRRGDVDGEAGGIIGDEPQDVVGTDVDVLMLLQRHVIHALLAHADLALTNKRVVVGAGGCRVGLLDENTVHCIGFDVPRGVGFWAPDLKSQLALSNSCKRPFHNATRRGQRRINKKNKCIVGDVFTLVKHGVVANRLEVILKTGEQRPALDGRLQLGDFPFIQHTAQQQFFFRGKRRWKFDVEHDAKVTKLVLGVLYGHACSDMHGEVMKHNGRGRVEV